MQLQIRVYAQEYRAGGVTVFPLAAPCMSALAPTAEAAAEHSDQQLKN